MKPKPSQSPESVVREIKRKTRRKFNPEERIRIILEGLKGEDSIAAICRREGIAPSLYYKWSKSFLEAGKQRLKGDTMREANSDEISELRKENEQLKQLVAELSLKNRVLKKFWNQIPPWARQQTNFKAKSIWIHKNSESATSCKKLTYDLICVIRGCNIRMLFRREFNDRQQRPTDHEFSTDTRCWFVSGFR